MVRYIAVAEMIQVSLQILSPPPNFHMIMGIDEGPVVLAIENHRTGLLWNLMDKNPNIAAGLDAIFGPLCSLCGRVTDMDTGLPIHKAKVRLRRTKESEPYRTKTDQNGDYALDDIKCGTYQRLKVKKNAYEAYKERRLDIDCPLVRDVELQKKQPD